VIADLSRPWRRGLVARVTVGVVALPLGSVVMPAAVGTLAPLLERGHVLATFREARDPCGHAPQHSRRSGHRPSGDTERVPDPVPAQHDEHTPVVT
jgi:hypothetical protein